MYREQLLKCLRALELPEGQYCIFGGACLAVRDLRATDDIDLYITDQLYENFKQAGWQERHDLWPEPYLTTRVNGVLVEAYRVFDTENWQPRFQSYLKKPEVVAGYAFMPLDELYEWKASVRRPKDVRDMKLIDKYRRAPKLLK